jgi:hypothetical protein
MSFAGEEGLCTSRGKVPDQAMMICLAIVELLDGLRRFLVEGQGEYTFVGTDSSFSVQFRRGGEGRMTVRCGAILLGEVEGSHLCRAILSGVESFLGHPGNPLSGDAPVREDLLAAIGEFARLRGAELSKP